MDNIVPLYCCACGRRARQPQDSEHPSHYPGHDRRPLPSHSARAGGIVTRPTRDHRQTCSRVAPCLKLSPSICGGIGIEQHASLSLHGFGLGGFMFLFDLLILFLEKISSASSSCVVCLDLTTPCPSSCRQGQGGDSIQSKRLERPAGDKRFGGHCQNLRHQEGKCREVRHMIETQSRRVTEIQRRVEKRCRVSYV